MHLPYNLPVADTSQQQPYGGSYGYGFKIDPSVSGPRMPTPGHSPNLLWPEDHAARPPPSTTFGSGNPTATPGNAKVTNQPETIDFSKLNPKPDETATAKIDGKIIPVSYTHLTLPTKRIV